MASHDIHFFLNSSLSSLYSKPAKGLKAMIGVSKALWTAGAAPVVLEDGQEAVKKLMYAPLTFLSVSANSSCLASILAAAVSFLEGFSSSDLETNVSLSRGSSGEYVAHTELSLVPYRYNDIPVSSNSAANTLSQSKDSPLAAAGSHRFSMSQLITVQEVHALSMSEMAQLRRLHDGMLNSSIDADFIANDILKTADSARVAHAVLRFSAQVGLTISRSTLEELMRQAPLHEALLASRVFNDLRSEVGLNAFQSTSIITPSTSSQAVASIRNPRGSKLERLRSRTRSKKQ